MEKIRLLIVDDSALIRKLLTEIFNTSSDIEVVGTAPDPFVAREKIKQLKPDVITLDIEMPRMDGLTFLRNLMRLRPLPVVMISTLTEKGAEVTLEALHLGAVDFVAKPKVDVVEELNVYAEEIINKVITASKAHVKPLGNIPAKVSTVTPITNHVGHSTKKSQHFKTTNTLIALGASTGGTEAIKVVVAGLPQSTPAIVITQHLPAAFSDSFARHVNLASAMNAVIAQEGQSILPGNIYIAPGDKHLQIVRDGARYVCQLDDRPAVNRHKPAVDVMFDSVAENVAGNAIGVLLTGMGADGAKGMQKMHQAGATTLIQDEASSVVWGMPGEAFKLACTDHVLALDQVAGKIQTLVN